MSLAGTRLSYDLLYEHTHSHAFGGNRARGGDRVGLEIELMPFLRPGVVDETNGCRHEAVPTTSEILRALERIGVVHGWDTRKVRAASPIIRTASGGAITLEPGGQIEYSTRPCADAVSALDDVDDVIGLLTTGLADAGIELRAKGYNNHCDVDLQLRTPRYVAMDSHFSSVGPYGRKMMRATAALQINLDFGIGSVAAERWRLANMIAPAMNALFANSPHVHEGVRYRSFRHEIWRRADPSRTGRLFDLADLDPVADYLRFALDARVMLVVDDVDGCARPQEAMTFRQWLERSQAQMLRDASRPRSGATEPVEDAASQHPHTLREPTLRDWELHLTTLFPDVRARGFMELRSIDALPARYRRVAVALVTTLLYVDEARWEGLHRLELRQREPNAADAEHDGYWRSDYSTGRELLEIALPHVDPRLHDACNRYHIELASKGKVPAEMPAAADI